MQQQDNVRNIQWLFITTLLVAFFAHFSYIKTIDDYSQYNDVEKKLITDLIWQNAAIHDFSIDKYKSGSTLERLRLEFVIMQTNGFVAPSITVEDLEERALEFSLESNEWGYFSGKIYFLETMPRLDLTYPPKDLKFDGKMLIIGNFINDFFITGHCKISRPANIEEDKGYFICDPDDSQLNIIEHDLYVFPVKSDKTFELDINSKIKALVEFVNSNTNVPVLNLKIPTSDLWLGLYLIAFFLQFYSLATLRALAIEDKPISGWLFVSWIYIQNKGFLDRLSSVLLTIVGIGAYVFLAVGPLFIISIAAKLRALTDRELLYNYWQTYLLAAPTLILIALTFNYLLVILQYHWRNFGKKKGSKSTEIE